MAQFVDRQEELGELNTLLASATRGKSEFVIVYGRRRIGKKTLILNWTHRYL